MGLLSNKGFTRNVSLSKNLLKKKNSQNFELKSGLRKMKMIYLNFCLWVEKTLNEGIKENSDENDQGKFRGKI